MLISFFLVIIISSSLTVPGQPSPRFHVEAWLPFRNHEMDMSFYIADKVRSTEFSIKSSNPTSEWNNCFIKNQTLDKISRIYFLPTRVFSHFEGKFSVIRLSVYIFGKTTGYYMIYTLRREPIKLPEIWY